MSARRPRSRSWRVAMDGRCCPPRRGRRYQRRCATCHSPMSRFRWRRSSSHAPTTDRLGRASSAASWKGWPDGSIPLIAIKYYALALSPEYLYITHVHRGHMNTSDTLAQLKARRQAFDATSRDMARLEGDRIMAEQALRVAAGSAAVQAKAKLGEIQTAIAKYREELQGHIDAIGTAPVADQLRAARETVVAKGSALLSATSADWQKAKA